MNNSCKKQDGLNKDAMPTLTCFPLGVATIRLAFSYNIKSATCQVPVLLVATKEPACSIAFLFVVVGLSPYNAARPIELFHENEAYHLVREGHFGKRNLFVGTAVHRL